MLELRARGNSEHFFCESLRIDVVSPPPRLCFGTGECVLCYRDNKWLWIFQWKALVVISILPLNCSGVPAQWTFGRWPEHWGGSGPVHSSVSGFLTHQLLSLSPDVQARQAHLGRAFSWGLSSWIPFDSGTHPRPRSPGAWGLKISDGHWIFGASLEVESGDKFSLLLGLEGNHNVGNWSETPDPEKTQMALTGRNHHPALWSLLVTECLELRQVGSWSRLCLVKTRQKQSGVVQSEALGCGREDMDFWSPYLGENSFVRISNS